MQIRAAACLSLEVHCRRSQGIGGAKQHQAVDRVVEGHVQVVFSGFEHGDMGVVGIVELGQP
jgi:hypothetical protein